MLAWRRLWPETGTALPGGLSEASLHPSSRRERQGFAAGGLREGGEFVEL